jgi:hypothetical protein
VLAIDHLVYAASDLEQGVGEIEQLLGVRATPGGSHPGFGTRNALLALGEDVYLEIIAPDPAQKSYLTPRIFSVDAHARPRLTTWAAKAKDLEALARRQLNGALLGAVVDGRRKTDDGQELRWRFTNPQTVVADGVVPFFIDWGASANPAGSAAKGATLKRLRAQHPDAKRVGAILGELGLELEVSRAPAPALIATIIGLKGEVELS